MDEISQETSNNDDNTTLVEIRLDPNPPKNNCCTIF